MASILDFSRIHDFVIARDQVGIHDFIGQRLHRVGELAGRSEGVDINGVDEMPDSAFFVFFVGTENRFADTTAAVVALRFKRRG